MRTDEQRESKKQPSILIDYCLIWWGPLTFVRHFVCDREYVTLTSILSSLLFSPFMVKKSRFRRLSNLPKVRELGSRWAGIWETQECLFQDWLVFFHLFLPASIPKAIHKLETNKKR